MDFVINAQTVYGENQKEDIQTLKGWKRVTFIVSLATVIALILWVTAMTLVAYIFMVLLNGKS